MIFGKSIREIEKEIIELNKIYNTMKRARTDYDNYKIAKLQTTLTALKEKSKQVQDIFAEDYNSKWTQEFITRLSRGCTPPEAFDFIKKDIKNQLEKI